jgi:hypothetical protein
MKTKYVLCAVAAAAALTLATGCKKAADQVKVDTSKMTEQQKQEITATDTAIFNRAMDRFKYLVDQKSWADAASQLKAFDGLNMTPEQKAQLDALKAQIPASAIKK